MHFLSFGRLLLAISLAANGTAMLAMPQSWYALMPGVTETGPLNPHFVRDIGAAYLTSSIGFFWLWRDARAWRAALTGSAFLVLHALIHLGETLAGTINAHHLLRDLPGVFLVPVLALWLALAGRNNHSLQENYHAEMDRAAPARRI